MELLITALIVLLSALIKGSTGFGFSMTALPLLALQLPVKTAVPMITIWSLSTSIIILLQKKEFTITREHNAIIGWGAVGTLIGTLFLAKVNDQILILATAILFAILTLLSLAGIEIKIKNRRRATIPTGLISGALAGSISVSGPPVTLFLNAVKTTKVEFREIFARFDTLTSTVALIGFSVAGLIDISLVINSLIFLPVIYAGTFIGKRINHHLPAALFKRINLVLSLASCIILLVKYL